MGGMGLYIKTLREKFNYTFVSVPQWPYWLNDDMCIVLYGMGLT